MSENTPSVMCAQRRFKSACAFAQSDQNLRWAHFNITKTCLCNFDPLKPHFYVEKMGFAGVYIIAVSILYKSIAGRRAVRVAVLTQVCVPAIDL